MWMLIVVEELSRPKLKWVLRIDYLDEISMEKFELLLLVSLRLKAGGYLSRPNCAQTPPRQP